MPAVITLSLFSIPTIAQVQSHPLSQLYPIDVNLNVTGVNITNVSYVFFGNNSVDTYLYRSGTNILQTASHLVVTGGWVNSTSFNASNQICLGGVCNTAWPSFSNNMTGVGTAGYIPQWANATALNNSNIFQLGSNIGIGTTTPQNKLDVEGGAVIGATYSGTETAPSNGLLVEGKVGIGVASSTNIKLAIGDSWIGFDNPAANTLGIYAGSAERMRIDGNSGNVGIGTASPNYLLEIANNSKALNVSGTLFVNGTTGRVGIGTTTPTTRLFVNGNATINGSAVGATGTLLNVSSDGSLGPWSENSSTNGLPVGLGSRHGSVVANGYVYAIGGNDGATTSTVYYSRLNANGSTSTWSTTTALPAARQQLSSVVANGYVYAIGGSDGSTTQTTVYYAKINPDGTLGAWYTNANTLPAARHLHSSVVANGYVYAIGGYSSQAGAAHATVFYSRLNSDGSTGTWSTNTSTAGLPAIRYAHSSVVANGYVYVMGGAGAGAGETTVYYAILNSDGSTSTWSTTTALPQDRYAHSSVVANGYVYAIGGTVSGAISPSTVYAKINPDGTLGAWYTNANTLPNAPNYHASVVANGYVYVIGGTGANATVFYASTARVQLSASLDLLSGCSLTNSSGDCGSSIYAGNIYSANNLEVSGNAQLWNGLSVNGLLSVKSYSSNLTINSSSPLFTVINGSNTTLLTVLSSGNVGIGTSTATAKLNVSGNISISGTSTGIIFNDGTFQSTTGTGNITGALTSGYIPQVASSSSLNNSNIFQLGSNVGIGTTSPQSLLHVSGTGNLLNISNSTNSFLFVNGSSGEVHTSAFNITPPVGENNITLVSAVTARGTTSTTYVKQKEIRLPLGGKYLMSFEAKDSAGCAGANNAQIYKNGAAVGTNRIPSSESYVTFFEEIGNWKSGDLAQLYVKTTNGACTATIQNFTLYGTMVPSFQGAVAQD